MREPKISQFREVMIKKLSEVCNIETKRINIKATTSEKLGFTGRQEGIAVLTTILIYKK